MITLHHLENSRSQRILWLLEELGVDYQLQIHKRDQRSQLAPKALKQIHPLGKSPILVDDGEAIVESAIIIEHLIEQHSDGTLIPERGTAAWKSYHYWMHAAEGSVMPFMVSKLLFTAITKPPVPFVIRPLSKAISSAVCKSYIDPGLDSHLAYMETALAQRSWFAGEALSGADFQMLFPAQGAMAQPGAAAKYPNIKRFVDTVEARPAYQQALAKGGEYTLGV